MSDPNERAEAPLRPAGRPLGEPGASIPRWLALLVLIALLASGALSAWLVLTGSSDTPAVAAESAID